MVEQNQIPEEGFEDKSFLEVPAILDKYKAAALIADGKFDSETFEVHEVERPSIWKHSLFGMSDFDRVLSYRRHEAGYL